MARGELDIFSAHTMSRELQALRDSTCPHVVVNVAGVSFVDASALGVLARTVATLDADHTSMGFVETSPRFRRLCAMTGLDVVFGVPSDR